MEEKLFQFCDYIRPNKDYIAHCDKTVQKIYSLLKNKSEFSVESFHMGGGIPSGKDTSTTLKVDADVVINVIKDLTTPRDIPHFKDLILKEWKGILEENTECDDKDDVITRTTNSLHFRYRGVWIDLLVSILLESSPEENLARIHKILDTLEEICDDKEEMEKLEKSLGADLNWAGVEFMKRRSHFVIDLARLAKFWSQTVYYDGCRNGKSFLVELVAVSAAMEEEEAKALQDEKLNAAMEKEAKALQDEKLNAAMEEEAKALQDEKLNAAMEEEAKALQDDKLNAAMEEEAKALQDEKLNAAMEEETIMLQTEKLNDAKEEEAKALQDEKLNAAMEEEREALQTNSEPSYVSAFLTFLKKMELLNSINVVFLEYYDKNTCEDILCQVPLLLNPVNPHQNLAVELTDETYRETMRTAARITIEKLQSDNYDFEQVFEPQNTRKFNQLSLRSITLDFIDQSEVKAELMPTIEFNSLWLRPKIGGRNRTEIVADRYHETKRLLLQIQRMAGSVVRCKMFSHPESSHQDIERSVEQFLKRVDPNWRVTRGEKGELRRKDVTVKIPLSVQSFGEVMRLEFNIISLLTD